MEFISFSVKVSGRCPDIEKIEDPRIIMALDILERQLHSKIKHRNMIDEESIPILRDHKIKFYENELRLNINRKYKTEKLRKRERISAL